MNEEKGLRFVRIIPYIIIAVILVEVGVIMYDMFLKEDTVVLPNRNFEKNVSLVLAETNGKSKASGENITIEISGENYGELSCSSEDEEIATCSIEGSSLVVTPGKKAGIVKIKLTEAEKNKTVEYEITIEEEKTNQNLVSNPTTVVTPAPVVPTPAPKPTPSPAPAPTPVVSTTLGLSATSGTAYVSGNAITVAITGSNYGQLTCASSDTKIATCGIVDSTLNIIPKYVGGTAYITVKEAKQSKTVTYTITVKKEYECAEGVLAEDPAKGFICLTNGEGEYKEVCTNTKTTQTESNPICVDDDITGVYNNETLIIGCSVDKITSEEYHCNNQHLCVIVEIKKECTEYDYEYEYKCPSGFNRFSSSNYSYDCYKYATLKK